MAEKALALLLAEELEWQTQWKPHAAELRRLHEVEQQRAELLAALVSFTKSDYIKKQHPIRYAAARAAIAKAEGAK
jgi:hypothetical protein